MHVEEGAIELGFDFGQRFGKGNMSTIRRYKITTLQTGHTQLDMCGRCIVDHNDVTRVNEDDHSPNFGRLENYICSGLLSLSISRNDHSFFTEFSHKRSILLREEYR